jgi:hypothetical protein
VLACNWIYLSFSLDVPFSDRAVHCLHIAPYVEVTDVANEASDVRQLTLNQQYGCSWIFLSF